VSLAFSFEFAIRVTTAKAENSSEVERNGDGEIPPMISVYDTDHKYNPAGQA